MNKEQIVEAIYEMRDVCVREQRDAIMRVGRAVVEEESSKAFIQFYHEAKAKVLVIDELLEKIANTPEDTGKAKYED